MVEKGGCMKAAAGALAGKKAVMVGLASTGISCAAFLKKCGASVVATDEKGAEGIAGAGELAGLGIELSLGGHDRVDLKGVDLVVVSPGVPYRTEFLKKATEAGAEVISDIELAYRFLDAPVLAVAGTNGKTTTTELLGAMCKDAGKKVFVGGNIGTPAVEYVASGGGADACVLEISSFHLETTKTFNPKVGILLNITDDHLDRYDDFAHYAGTKFRLFENQGAGDYAVVNSNDAAIAARLKKGLTRGKVVPFNSAARLDEGLWLDDDSIVFKCRHAGVVEAETYPFSGIRLKGLHNMENVMAAVAAARLNGVERESILKTLASFEGLHHRMEHVRTLDGVEYIDDSKGTNVGAVAMALRGLQPKVVLIAGGRDKGGDYGVLADQVREKVRALVLIGEARFKIRDSLGALTDTVIAASLEEAVTAARARALPGDTVLLSPACSSFDMFSGYKQRGERFRAIVESL